MQEMYEGDTEVSANITYQNVCRREIEAFMETLQEKIRKPHYINNKMR